MLCDLGRWSPVLSHITHLIEAKRLDCVDEIRDTRKESDAVGVEAKETINGWIAEIIDPVHCAKRELAAASSEAANDVEVRKPAHEKV